MLQVAGEGDDPTPFADQFGGKVPFQARGEVEEIHQLPAIIGIARVVDEGQEINVFLAWIAKDGLVYRVLGAAPSRVGTSTTLGSRLMPGASMLSPTERSARCT